MYSHSTHITTLMYPCMPLDLTTFPFMGRVIISGALHFVHNGNISIRVTSRRSAHRLCVAITNVTAELG